MRKQILVGIIVGLIISISVGFITRDYSYELTSENAARAGLCTGIDHFIDVSAKITYGVPFKWESGSMVKQISTCSVGYNPKPTINEIGIHYIQSWQLFANWMVFSIPLIGIVYLKENRHANNRH